MAEEEKGEEKLAIEKKRKGREIRGCGSRKIV